MIVWLIGISGAGKTTIGRALVDKLRADGRSVLFIDGDEIRTVWKDNLGHSVEARRRNHSRLSQLCKVLDQDGVDIVVSALSIFPDLRAWNRRNFNRYFEVYLDLPVEEARRRDPKGIYAKRDRGETGDVVGVDIPFPFGDTVDLHIAMPDILGPPETIADAIASALAPSAPASGHGEPYRYDGRDLFEDPESYEFAPCHEPGFFHGWRAHRAAATTRFLAAAGRRSAPPLGDCVAGAPASADAFDGTLQAIMHRLYMAAEAALPDSQEYAHAKRTMDEFVKKFEIFRRLFDRYDERLRRADGAAVVDIHGYCAFGAALVAFHRRTGVPIYSSTLLKLIDAILSREMEQGDAEAAGKIAALLQAEHDAVRYWERHTETVLRNREDGQS